MCEGSASIAVDRDGVEGACGGREVLPVGLLMRPRSDRGRSCERVNGSIMGAGLWLASLGLAFNPIDHRLCYLVWFLLDLNP